MRCVDIDKEAVLLAGDFLFIHEEIPLNTLGNWPRGVQHSLPLSERLRTLQWQENCISFRGLPHTAVPHFTLGMLGSNSAN
jgi:hypothetical protein